MVPWHVGPKTNPSSGQLNTFHRSDGDVRQGFPPWEARQGASAGPNLREPDRVPPFAAELGRTVGDVRSGRFAGVRNNLRSNPLRVTGRRRPPKLSCPSRPIRHVKIGGSTAPTAPPKFGHERFRSVGRDHADGTRLRWIRVKSSPDGLGTSPRTVQPVRSSERDAAPVHSLETARDDPPGYRTAWGAVGSNRGPPCLICAGLVFAERRWWTRASVGT
jgi:hypothetical protein